MEAMSAEFGRIDVLVNSAAGNFRCPAAELSPNAWRTVIDIDLNGTLSPARRRPRRPCARPATV